jgi:hypothetical protein
LPIFSLIVIGMVGLADLIVAEQLLAEASARGARTAALGGSEEQIRQAVQAVLGPQRAQHIKLSVSPVDCRDNHADDGANGGTPGRLHDKRNDHGKCCPGELIEVRVELEAQFATATRFCPVSSNELLIGRTVMQCE